MHVGCACLSLARSGADRALKQWSTIELPKYASHFWLGTHINREIEPCAIDEGKAAHGPTLAAGHSRAPPSTLPPSLARSLSLFVTHKRRADDVDDHREDQLNQGLQQTQESACHDVLNLGVENRDGGEAESERGFCCGKRGSLVRHRLSVCMCE